MDINELFDYAIVNCSQTAREYKETYFNNKIDYSNEEYAFELENSEDFD